MYEKHFGLTQLPFGMSPDYAFLLQTTAHREALAGLTYTIITRKGFGVLLGEAGTGKTTLLSKVLGTLPPEYIQFSLIVNPLLTPQEFLEAVLLDFGMRDIPASKPLRLLALQEFIMRERALGKVCLLAVDEAHKLTPELLEEIRLLTNLETSQEKLLQIVLVGQPELDDVLNRLEMRQLKQRIAVRLRLEPLATAQVGRYIDHRWEHAGGKLPSPFSPEAVQQISEAAGGIPRLINALCDNALLGAYGQGQLDIDRNMVKQVVKNLRWHSPRPEVAYPIQPMLPASPFVATSATAEEPLLAISRYPSVSSKISRWLTGAKRN